MSPLARHRGLVAVLVLMLALAFVNLSLVIRGREGSWVTAGTALGVAVGSLSQLSIFSPTGNRREVTTLRKVQVLVLALATAVCLVVGGVISESAFIWVIVSIFFAGVVGMVVGFLRNAGAAAEESS